MVDGGRRTASSTQKMKNETPGRRAYKLKEAASLLGVSTVSLRRAISRGLIKPSRAFRHVIISTEELDRFLRTTSAVCEGGES
ncbi:helix-turn-helix domain-containing protein [Prosthecobacter sp.]|uniref:helix-turn-helix domain-containing protein n=1 Tax=Prosthecobacter sp. TaxID=1965333 RepID=UPI003783ECAC